MNVMCTVKSATLSDGFELSVLIGVHRVAFTAPRVIGEEAVFAVICMPNSVGAFAAQIATAFRPRVTATLQILA